IPFAGKVLHWGANLPKVGGFFKKILQIGEGKIKKMTGAIMFGLFLFVAIPAPGTGAWTGCLIATLLNLPLRKAFLPIAMGVLTAGIIMGIGSYGLLGFLA
ncbi:MAG: small multi-drug export protein, partial [Oscillospiraceae bacterium]